MRKLISVISILFVVFIFMGTTGLRVFKHACEEDGVFTSYFIQLDDHCTDHQEELPACCEKEKDKDDCCSDEVDIYTVDFDYFQDSDIQVPGFLFPAEITPFFELYPTINDPIRSAFLLRPPPFTRSGRDILAYIQIFRI